MGKAYFYYQLILSVIDFILLNISIIITVMFIKGHGGLLSVGERYFFFLLFMNLAWGFCIMIGNRLKSGNYSTFRSETAVNIIKAFLLTSIASMLAFSVKELLLSRIAVYGTILIFFLLQTAVYGIFRKFIWRAISKGIKRSNVIIAGKGEIGRRIMDELVKDSEFNIYSFCGFLDDDGGESVIGKLSEVKKAVEAYNADEIIISLPEGREKSRDRIIESANYHGIRVKIALDLAGYENISDISYISGIPVASLRNTPLDKYSNSMKKRLFDILFSFIVIMAFLPFFPVLALLIKLSSRGPVFYRAERTGSQGNRFRLFKLRTMYHSKKEPGESTRRDDERIFPLGGILRKLNIDELPQFYNVLKGDMSVVGPRPHRTELDRILQDQVEWYMLRYYVKPGITGWAQVNGWRGPTDTDERRQKRIEYDLWYINNWSFWLDLKIILLTIFSRKSWRNAF